MGRKVERVRAGVFSAVVVLVVGAGAGAGAGVGSAGPAHAADPGYVALGDSYSSGLGTREYHPDSGGCHRSPYAFPELAAAALGVQLAFDACSGADTGDVSRDQLGSLSASTDYVSISVGGNDAGFSRVLTACAQPWPVTCWQEIDEARAIIQNALPGRLDEVYSAVSDQAPNAHVVVVGYPRLFDGEECHGAARISSGEQVELNKTGDMLVETIAARAGAHGFGFVDVRTAFDGHAVCDGEEWINGLSHPVEESYHPNRAGHARGYAPLVEDALRAPHVL